MFNIDKKINRSYVIIWTKLRNSEKLCNQIFLKEENYHIYKTGYVKRKLDIEGANFFKRSNKRICLLVNQKLSRQLRNFLNYLFFYLAPYHLAKGFLFKLLLQLLNKSTLPKFLELRTFLKFFTSCTDLLLFQIFLL